ncbi:RNA polymerase sigma factor [Mucilaginibacter sp. HD30]
MKTSVRYQIYKRRKATKLNIVFKDGVIAHNRYESNEGEVRISKIKLDNKLGNYVAQLPKRCQEIFELSRSDGLSNQEIASKLVLKTHSRKSIDISNKTPENLS